VRQIAFKRPGMHNFAAFLPDPAELNPLLNVFRPEPDFLFEFD
jgi:hypothetical protein